MTFEGTEEEKQAEISRLKEELSFGKAQVCAMTDKGQAKGGAQKLKKLEEHLSATVFALKELDESWVPGRWVEQHIHWETKKELPGEAGKRGSNSKEARSSGNDDENDPEEEEDEEDKERADASGFLQEYPARFRISYDPEGRLAEQYGVEGMPSSFVIGRDGQLMNKHLGFKVRKQQEVEL